ncbi:peptidase C39 family protein [Archangium sp. Cb G35]|uniref:peptidase C39 family protein n=1 Tax=Archangium sp. Cb G35 TaxID=1920190 RepID=UPI000B0E03CE|nr:peptidase C39 family protein [Archangium sp. Cb G35]
MTIPTKTRHPLFLVLLASTLTACTWQARPTPEEQGPVAKIWRKSAQTRDFERFTREGTALTPDGTLELDAATARSEADPFPSHTPPNAQTPLPAGSYVFGSAASEEHTITGGFDNVVPSFDVLTPPGTWVRLTLAARVEGEWTKDYDFGVWAFDNGTVVRHSKDRQEDERGKVFTDTLVLKKKADGLRMKVWLFSSKPGVSPRVRALTAAMTDSARKAADEPSDKRAWGTVLEVPGRSQMLYPPKGGVWCSPTSVSMILAYWGQKLGRNELVVPVPVAAEYTYDTVYDGTGNWPFNTAYGSAIGDGALHGLVARFDSFAQVERLIAEGIPVSISIAYEKGELSGSPVQRSDGHLIVVKGFTPEGDVICNDPAFPNDELVNVTYKREELLKAWDHSRRSAYVLWPSGSSLPAGALTFVQ